jgi:hypothetical protein
MSLKTKSVLVRFIKATIAGAVSAMGLIPLVAPTEFTDFRSIFYSLAVACLFGGLTGLLMALQKWASWK